MKVRALKSVSLGEISVTSGQEFEVSKEVVESLVEQGLVEKVESNQESQK